MLFIRRTLLLTSILLYAHAYGWTTPASVLTHAYRWTTPASVSTRIRLVGGSSVHEGRVEVFHKDEWGTVCDDEWNDTDASVVCRQLGYSDGGAALSNATFGQGSGPIWLDDVACTGSEGSLQDCGNIRWGSHDCLHSEDAGVRCFLRDDLPTTTPPVRSTSYNEYQELNCNFEYGTCLYSHAMWDFEWTRHQGSTPSSNTGPPGDHTTGTGYYMYIEATSKEAYSRARLNSYVQLATDDQGLCLSFFYHMYGDAIGTLTVFLNNGFREEPIFRRSQNQGNEWRRATVQLRSTDLYLITFEGTRGTDYQGDIAIDDISVFPGPCSTEDMSETQPDYTAMKTTTVDHFTTTTTHPVISNSTTIRLVGGSSAQEGRVEVFHNGQWGTVCDDNWHDIDAAVVCRQLGYSGGAFALSNAAFGQGSGRIWLDDVICRGNEKTLQECRSNGWGSHNCGHNEDAGIRCLVNAENSSTTIPPVISRCHCNSWCSWYKECCSFCQGWVTLTTPSVSATIRLANGSSLFEGRVEIFYNGQWGTVCDDSWDDRDATVVCRQLGYRGGGSALFYAFGQGEGSIWLDDVQCVGGEKRLQDCGHNGWGSHNCAHAEDAGVRCVVDDGRPTTPAPGNTTCYCYPGCARYNECCSYCKAGHPTTSAPASTTCYCYSGCSRYNECCSYCKDNLPTTTPPVRSRCHCRSWCYRYNECCSYCQHWYITQSAVLTTTTAPVRTRCHCRSSCYWYNECCSYCPSWYTTPSVLHNEYQELNCNFEYGTCGYFQTTGDDFDWTRHQGSTPSSNTGPPGDHTTGTGYYMYIEATSKAAYSTARLISYEQDATGDQGLCLSFFYHMHGDAIGTLTVFLSARGDEEAILRRSHTEGYRWWRATAHFRSSSAWRIIFEGRRGTDYQGDIAIDDIAVFPGPCLTEVSNNQLSELNCTFEYGTCGYYQGSNDTFDWTRHSGSTISSSTGPQGDHTTGRGYYMYIETSLVANNSRARLVSSPQDATNDQELCISFFYHMYGDDINTLTVFLSTGGNEELIFRRSQNQGNRWWQATAQFRSYSTWQIIFEGTKGADYQGDIAIDDISIFPGPCPTEDLPTTQPEDISTTAVSDRPWCYCGQGCVLHNECCSYCPHLTKVVFVDSVYKFTSPNFPGAYPNHLAATWHFSTFEGYQLLLKFQVLATEKCCDFVKVGNGNSTDTQIALRWSGGQPESEVRFLSSRNTMWMTFRTDSTVTATGFEASVEVVNIGLTALDCDEFHCVGEGVCIPHSRVCNRNQECDLLSDEENCTDWNTEEPGWNLATEGGNWATEDPLDEIILLCEPTSFQVDLPVQILPHDMQPNEFFLSGDPFDPNCRGFRNGDDYFSLNSSLTGCGTAIKETETLISYLNLVAYTRNTSGVMELSTDDLPVQCDYDRSKQLQSHFVITDESSQRIKRAKGSFIYDFSVYTNMNFDVRYYSYPVETTLDRHLYFRAELLKSPDNLRLHLRSCRATPSQNFDYAVVYEFIHDGCVINDANVRVLTPSSPVQAEFEIQSFRFWPYLSNITPQVWIHCEVVVCDANDPSSECLHDCERSRHRRSVAESSKGAKRLIQGPILFTDIEDLDQKSGSFRLMEEREEVTIFTVALTVVCLVMFLSLLVVGGALFRIMRRVKRMEYRPPQNERYSTL